MLKINKDVIEQVIKHYGVEEEQFICMEEMAELQQAISKCLRNKKNEENLIEEIADVLICIENLKMIHCIKEEEIADVLICIENLKMIHCIKEEEIQKVIDYKQNRVFCSIVEELSGKEKEDE